MLKKVKKTNKKFGLLLLLVLLFIIIRSIHFTKYLNFSSDQAIHSAAALHIFRSKEIVLIGPAVTSLAYEGRHIFYGPLVYYFQMLFLILGGFDPINASYAFMLFAALMIIPLYIGVKNLLNEKAAYFFVIVYTFLPYYINYTRFLWNPNFQFVLFPLFVFLMGLFHKKRTYFNFFILSFMMGSLLQFHHLFLIVILILLFFYFFVEHLSPKFLIIFLSGFILGISPILLFELRHNFYNTRTLILLLQHHQNVFPGIGEIWSSEPHYFLSLSFFGLLTILAILKNKIKSAFLIFLLIILGGWSALVYAAEPAHGYGMVSDWNYNDEAKVHQIITAENISNFNVMNLAYDTLAEVQKYLLQKDNLKINLYDYKSNDYLFIITDRKDFMDDAAYEIKTFRPAKVVKSWQINKRYNLYLVQRVGL